MPKKKTDNQFGKTTGTMEAGAPGDEKPAPTVKFKKNGEPFKVRGPNTVNPKIAEFRKNEKQALADFVAGLKAARKTFLANLRIESAAAKLQAKMEKTALKMSPEQLEWLRVHAEKKLAAKTP